VKKIFFIGMLVCLIAVIISPIFQYLSDIPLMIHKVLSTLLILLIIIHTFVNFKDMNAKRWALFILAILAFVTGIFAMIDSTSSWGSPTHKAVSLLFICGTACHLFVYHKKMFNQRKASKSEKN
jgi:hypothetical protein